MSEVVSPTVFRYRFDDLVPCPCCRIGCLCSFCGRFGMRGVVEFESVAPSSERADAMREDMLAVQGCRGCAPL